MAGALIGAQHGSGGWNYLADFGGEKSLREWYDTVGRNAWRMEEFQVQRANATFDDARPESYDALVIALGAELNVHRIEGLPEALDCAAADQFFDQASRVASTYAGLGSRTTTNSFWQPASGALDTTTTTTSGPRRRRPAGVPLRRGRGPRGCCRAARGPARSRTCPR